MELPALYPHEQPPWVILRLGAHKLALSSAWVREIVALPPVISLPEADPNLRGMVDIRSRVMPLMDLRRRLGLPSLRQEAGELIRELAEQAQAHLKWIEELRTAVVQGRPFAMETNPGQCPFGRWLGKQLTAGGILAERLGVLDTPHQMAHRVAQEIAGLLAQDQAEKAAQLLDRALPGRLMSLSRALERCQRDLRQPQKEIALLVQDQELLLALAVDEVEAVEPLEPGGVNWSRLDMGRINRRLVSGAAQRLQGGEVVFLLELNQLLEEGRRLIP